ncbi:glycosyltransferase family 39 protein, partial [Bacteroidota bacterium]
WQNKPLTLILFLAIIFRLIAVIFSKGYGMFDDHFLIIESSQSWVDDFDYNNWLPSSGAEKPTGHSFFYPGFHYLLFSLFEFLGLNDPQGKMYFIRLIHAAFSLLTIVFGFRITQKLSNISNAKIVGLLLAVFWFMPFLSVRNMVEIVCIPFLMWGTWMIIKELDGKNRWWIFFLAGLILGISFSIRFQTAIFSGGLGLVLLFQKKWKEPFIMAAGYIVAVFMVQGLIDIFIWGYPFAELSEYVMYNSSSTNYSKYITGSPWYSYILLICGLLIPPVSLFLFFGFFRKWKKELMIFLPTLLFLIFHSMYPNKQERFILSIIPFIIILGVIGWQEFVQISKYWNKHKRLLKACWTFFWVINTILLLLISTYSKRSLVESMYYLSDYQNKDYIVIDNSNEYGVPLLPRYYADEWVGYINISKSLSPDKINKLHTTQENFIPSFFLFMEEENIQQRLNEMKKVFPNLEYETTIYPGFIDNVMHWLNPINKNRVIIIYRNTQVPG